MQISGIQSGFSYLGAQVTQTNRNAGSFNDNVLGVGDNAVQDFMDYMKESPAQQMFTNFLSSHHISQNEYNAMSPQQKEALTKQFEQELKQQMGTESNIALAVGSK